MNIIYARMPGYEWVSVPSDSVIRNIEKMGHRVFWATEINNLPITKVDFVISLYESTTLLGDAISKILNIPHYSHIEVLPPWRVKKIIDPEKYGLFLEHPEITENTLNKTIPYYIKVGMAWKNAKLKSISNHCRVDFHKKLLNGVENIILRYPSVDTFYADTAKKMYSPKKQQNKIITVSRATHIKRYDLLIQVMNLVQSKVIWTIVGDGPMLGIVKQKVVNPNITLDIVGPKWGWSKWYELMSANILIYAMGGMCAVEAALVNTFPIVIENPPTHDLPEFDKFMRYNYGNNKDDYKTTFFPIFKDYEIEEMAKKIDEKINTSNLFNENQDIVKNFLQNSMNVTSSYTNAKDLMAQLENYNT